LRQRLTLIKEVSSDCFGAYGLWSVRTPVFESSFYRRKAKFLGLNNVKSARSLFFFGFLNVSNVCGLYILTCNDSQQEGM